MSMGLLKHLLPKAPERYEDIVSLGSARIGTIRKLRLILFFVKRPDEYERYRKDFEAKLLKYVGRDFYDRLAASPREELKRLRNDAREIRKKMKAAQRERSGLLAQAADCERLLGATGKEVSGV
jgi:hypothetical protein